MKKIAKARLASHVCIDKQGKKLISGSLSVVGEDALKALLTALLRNLLYRPDWLLKYSGTIAAISEDLGIAQEKPTSGPIQDTVPETSGADSGDAGKCSEKGSGS